MGDENAKYGQNKEESASPCCDMSAQAPLVSLLNGAYRGDQIFHRARAREILKEVGLHIGCARLYGPKYSSIPD